MWVGSIFEEQFEFFQTLLQSLKAGLSSGNASISSLCLAFLEALKERPCVQLFLFHMPLFTILFLSLSGLSVRSAPVLLKTMLTMLQRQ